MVCAFVLLGAFLRLQQLPAQWLADDEWHAIHLLQRTQGYAPLQDYVGLADVSTPLALYGRWLMEGPGLDELRLRLPSVVAGLLLLLLGSIAVWRRYGPATATAFCGLLALSPMLVYYTRSSRPYALALLFAWIALLLALQWRRRPGLLLAMAYLAFASAAAWLHASVLPFVGAPLVWMAAASMWARDGRATLVVSALGISTLLPIVALVLAPLWRNRTTIAERIGTDAPSLDTAIGVAHQWIGSEYSWLVAMVIALALVGAWQSIRERDTWFGYGVLGTAAIALGVMILQPAWVQIPLTAARYHLPALPLLLLCVARGIVLLASRLPTAKPLLATLVPLSLLLGSNTLALTSKPNQFSMHSWYQLDYRPDANPVRVALAAIPVSSFWHALAKRPPRSLTIAVAGHHFESFTINDVRWQPIHRQRVLSGQRRGLCGQAPYLGEGDRSSGVRLRNAVDLADLSELRAARVSYIAFNLTIWQDYAREQLDLETCIDRIAARHGPPVHRDADLVVFAVETQP